MLRKQTTNMIRIATAMIGFAAAMGGALALVTMIALSEGGDQPGLERPFATALIVSLVLAVLAYFVSRTLSPVGTKKDSASNLSDPAAQLEIAQVSELISDSTGSSTTSALSHLSHVHADIRDRLMDSSSGAIAILSAKHNILELSTAAAGFLGLRPIDAIGEDFSDHFVLDHQRHEMTNAVTRALAGTPVRGFDATMRTQNGQTRIMRWNMDPLHDADGHAAAILAIGSDITDLVYLSDTLQRRSALLDLMLRTTVVANQSRSITDALQHGVDQICAYTQWPVGHAWLVEESQAGILGPSSVWHLAYDNTGEPTPANAAFQSITQGTELKGAMGIPGAAYLSAIPEFGPPPDTDPRFKNNSAAMPAMTIAVPVISQGQVLSVLEFTTGAAEGPDASLLQALSQIGVQLGQVFERIDRQKR